MPTIKVLYSCPLCHLVDQEVDVESRGSDGSVADWMDKVVFALGKDHFSKNPECVPPVLAEIQIPVQEGVRIGDPVQTLH